MKKQSSNKAPTSKKLKLSSESLRVLTLTTDQLGAVAGGAYGSGSTGYSTRPTGPTI
jgi:hypothetical protein